MRLRLDEVDEEMLDIARQSLAIEGKSDYSIVRKDTNPILEMFIMGIFFNKG